VEKMFRYVWMRGTFGNTGVYKNANRVRGLMCHSGVPARLPEGGIGGRWGPAGTKGFSAGLSLTKQIRLACS